MQSIKVMELFKKDNGFGRNGQNCGFLVCNFMDVSVKELQQLIFFMLGLMSGPSESRSAQKSVKGETFGRKKKGFGAKLSCYCYCCCCLFIFINFF